MQAFYNTLTKSKGNTPYLNCLTTLSKSSVSQISALQTNVTWSIWASA